MEVKTCSRCNKVKDVNVFGGFKQCNTCRENGRVSNQKNREKKTETNSMKRQERNEQMKAGIVKIVVKTFFMKIGKNIPSGFVIKGLN